MLDNLLFATNAQKILNFMLQDPGREYLANEIQAKTKISKSGVHVALKKLADEKMLVREPKAQLYLYSVGTMNQPLIKQLKVLRTLLRIQPMLNKLKPVTEKIILYGSCARGEDSPASDIDLFVVSREGDDVKKIVNKFSAENKIQVAIRTPLAFVEMEKKDREYFEEISSGITLWEAQDGH